MDIPRGNLFGGNPGHGDYVLCLEDISRFPINLHLDGPLGPCWVALQVPGQGIHL